MHLKNKKNLKKKKKAAEYSSEEKDYDSMIENGTDESSNDDMSDSEVNNKPTSNIEMIVPGATKVSTVKKVKRKQNIETKSATESKKLKTAKELYKPPTVEELNLLKETENKHHSNLFRMQCEELLKTSNLSGLNSSNVKEFLSTLNRKVQKLKPKNVGYDNSKSIEFPFSIDSHDLENIIINFVPPKEPILIIGSEKLGTTIETHIDLCLIIPTEVFHKDDYLNLRYFYKKCLYIFHLANKLQFKFESVKYNYFKNDCLNPILEIDTETCKYLLHFICEKTQFKLKRFVPSMNNVKGRVLKTDLEKDNLEIPSTATPNYNYSILFDLTLTKNDIFLQEQFSSNQNVKDAIILLKIWLKQRNLDQGFYGFNGFLVTMYIAYLVKQHKIYSTMSSYQIIRLFWNHLSQSTWNADGISISNYAKENNDEEVPPPCLAEFHKYYDIVFVDSTGYTNICANVSIDLYHRIQAESKSAIQCLDDNQINSFQCLFMTSIPSLLQYDHILCIDHNDIFESVVQEFGVNEDKLNYYKNIFPHFRKMLMNVLRKGLNNRVLSITPISTKIESWNLYEKPKTDYLQFAIGLILNSEEALEVVSKGPQANQPEAIEFRQFWGDKSELRRFKDGSITESCVWGTTQDPVGEKRVICEKICKHLLLRHFDITLAFIKYSSNDFDNVIRSKKNRKMETVEEKSLACIRSFDYLSKELKNIENVPLDITAVLSVDPVFRYCDVNPPLSNASKVRIKEKTMFSTSKVMNGIIQLSASGKWPDDLQAITRLKTAFYHQISKSLHAKSKNIITHAYVNHFDVLTDKYLYRFQIVHPKEVHLNKKIVLKNNVTKEFKETEMSLKIEMESVILPKMNSLLHGLHQQHSSFGPAVAIAKRWVYSQLLDQYLWPDICTELLMASLYLRKYPYTPPFQPQTGFLRFLDLLATTDWRTELVMVNFNNDISAEQLEIFEKRFRGRRDTFPPLSVITSCDLDKHSLWTKKAPTAVILRRISILARHSMEAINKNLFNFNLVMVKNLFTPCFTGYGVILKLDESVINRTDLIPIEKIHSNKLFSNVVVDYEADFRPFADWDVVQLYLRDLREGYDNFALFFYDPCGGDKICVLWKPPALESKPFNAMNSMGRISESDNMLELNMDAIIEDFKLIGKGLVTDVVINNK